MADFTQADMDALASKVRGEEKAKFEKEVGTLKSQHAEEMKAVEGKYKDFDKVAEKATKFESLSAELENLKAQHQDVNTRLNGLTESSKKHLEKMVALIPEDKQRLIPRKLSEADRLEYVLENFSLLTPASGPMAPHQPSGDKPLVNSGKNNPTGMTPDELKAYVKEDPKGYAKARGLENYL